MALAERFGPIKEQVKFHKPKPPQVDGRLFSLAVVGLNLDLKVALE